MNKQAKFEGRKQILLFLRGPRMALQQFWKFPICFHVHREGNGKDDILSE